MPFATVEEAAELYRRGEATWTQKETFGRIEVEAL